MKRSVAFSDPQRASTSRWIGGRDSGSYRHHMGAAAESFVNWNPRWALAYEDAWTARSRSVQISTADELMRFQALAGNWRKERGITSSITQMVLCPSYQRIIGTMGERAVPFILRELENTRDDPDHWFWALEMITDADPVPLEAYGDTVRMAEAWLEWAQGRYAW